MDDKFQFRRTQFSEGVLHRDKLSIDTYTSSYKQAGKVTLSLNEFFERALPEGRSMPDFYLLQEMIGIIVKQDLDDLLDSDEENHAELRDYSKVTLTRNDESKRVIESLTAIRDSFDGLFGRGMCERYLGLGSRMPDDPRAVWRLGLRTILAVTAPEFELPDTSRISGVCFYPQQWADELYPHVEVLRASLIKLSEENRTSQSAQEDKDKDLKTHDENFGNCARLLEALYRIAGHKHLAKRLRPTRRTAALASNESPDDEVPDEESANGATDGETPDGGIVAGGVTLGEVSDGRSSSVVRPSPNGGGAPALSGAPVAVTQALAPVKTTKS